MSERLYSVNHQLLSQIPFVTSCPYLNNALFLMIFLSKFFGYNFHYNFLENKKKIKMEGKIINYRSSFNPSFQIIFTKNQSKVLTALLSKTFWSWEPSQQGRNISFAIFHSFFLFLLNSSKRKKHTSHGYFHSEGFLKSQTFICLSGINPGLSQRASFILWTQGRARAKDITCWRPRRISSEGESLTAESKRQRLWARQHFSPRPCLILWLWILDTGGIPPDELQLKASFFWSSGPRKGARSELASN